MPDNVEIRLEQLTQAVKSLYAKSSNSQSEVYNALNSLSQRYENLTSVSSEKIASTIINEFRKSLELKYGQTNQFIRDLEIGLKDFAQSQSLQNPKMVGEISRILGETSSALTKLNTQELTLHKILSAIELQKNSDSTEEIIKLSENFMNFSRGFENITITLNKNFADFLSQIKEQSSKEDFLKVKAEIDIISGNINSIISAISIIDTKYHDLTSLIDTFQNKELVFSDAIKEVTALSKDLSNLKEYITTLDSKDDINILGSQIKNQVESVKYEIQKIINTTQDTTIKEEVYSIAQKIQNLVNNTSNFNNLQNTIIGFGGEIKDIKDFIAKINPENFSNSLSGFEQKIQNIQTTLNTKDYESLFTNLANLNSQIQLVQSCLDTQDYENISNSISGFARELANIKSLINDEILFKSNQREAEFTKYLNDAKQDINNLVDGLKVFKDDINSINEGNIKILQEPIEKALQSLKNEEISTDIKNLSGNIKNITQEIQASIEKIQHGIDSVNSDSNMQVLADLTNKIPAILEKVESFKEQAVLKYSEKLNEVKDSFSNSVSEVKKNLLESIEKIQQDAQSINQETLDILKVDLQKLSDHLIDNVENVNNKIQIEFANYTSNFNEFATKQTTETDKFLDKITSLELNLEAYNKETTERIEDILSVIGASSQDNLSEIKGDILENITSLEQKNRNSLTQFEVKLDQIIDNLGSSYESLNDKKSLKEIILAIESKIERTNLQQIHNSKELLEELQSSTSSLLTRIENTSGVKHSQGIASAFGQLAEKLKSFESNNFQLSQEIKNLKELFEQKSKDNIQKVTSIIEQSIEKLPQENETSIDLNELSNKIQEYLSNFEFVKNNISQDIKENLATEFKNIENSIKRLKTNEDNPNYSYTLEDVESDLAKVCRNIEKNTISPEDFKNLTDKTIEVRSIGLENVKLNRDIEEGLGHINGWCKDAVAKIDNLAERLDEIQNIGFADLKTRLIQSEKSKHDSSEQNKKIETALKILIKNARTKDENIAQLDKKIELISKSQTETFNPAQFIDIFYENMTQTKMLSNRVEIIEDKINYIQNSVEKLLNYVEEN